MENFSGENLEAEIAELSRQIEEKKRVLETENKIVYEDKEFISQTVAENFYPSVSSASSLQDSSVGGDYLDSLPPEKIEILNSYISMVPNQGIRVTIKKIMDEAPFVIDAFHDALVTRLYDELKTRGIIK